MRIENNCISAICWVFALSNLCIHAFTHKALVSISSRCGNAKKASFPNQSMPSTSTRSEFGKQTWALSMGKRSSAQIMAQPWLPNNIDEDDIYAIDEERENLERKSIQYLALLVRDHLRNSREDEENQEHDIPAGDQNTSAEVAHDKFRDLTCTYEGELTLERIFDSANPELIEMDTDVVKGAIIALQSLTILGMQVGVKGTPEQQERNVAHLRNWSNDKMDISGLDEFLKNTDPKRLKHRVDITAGMQLLAQLKLKRNAQGAFDLLVRVGAWTKHEDLAFLRSGFPTRFTEEESTYASIAAADDHDPDQILGIRKDLRHLKVYTIDSEYTEEGKLET